MPQRIRDVEGPWRLVVFAVAGQLLIAAVTARLASDLSLEAFEAYAVAVAVFVPLVAVVPLGTDKLALRVLPPLLERGEWALVSGYIRFASRHACLGIGSIGIFGLLWIFGVRDQNPDAVAIFAIAALVIPAAVTAHLALEALTASGSAVIATFVFRVVIPGVTLTQLIVLQLLGFQLTAVIALAIWGAGWLAGALLLLLCLRKSFPSQVFRIRPAEKIGWRSAAWPFWTYRLLVALMAQAAIMALYWCGAPAKTVGAYAVAALVPGLMLVLSTSTNRAYSREIALVLESGSLADLRNLAWRRWRRLVPCLIALVLAVFAFSRSLLAWFRPEFIEEGLWPIRILTLASAFTMTFGLAPTVLKFRDRNRELFRTVAASAALQVLMLLLLAPRFGATGAALSYAVSAVVMYGWLAKLVEDELRSFPVKPAPDGVRK